MSTKWQESMQPERKLELVHFQITKRCNLRCWFCGQWGNQGSFAQKANEEMNFEDWRRVINSLERYTEAFGTRPSVVLWGGEPLISPYFAEITEILYDLGYSLGLITNGTLLDRHVSLCRQAFDRIYVSLDGAPQVHDAIRGAGVYERVAENLQMLHGGKAKLSIMTVMTPPVIEDLESTLLGFAKLQPDEVLLQEMIALTPYEVKQYQSWFKNVFNMYATDITSWQVQEQPSHRSYEWYMEWIQKHRFPFHVTHLPHGVQTGRDYCLSPFRHAHIAWDGSVGFCTDFSDFSVGNVRWTDLVELFHSEAARFFSQEILHGNCITCEHCSWRNSNGFRF